MRSASFNQINLLPSSQLSSDAYAWAHSDSEKGQIYTKQNVVEFMIALIGLRDIEYSSSIKILEPSCGEGEFVIGIARTIIETGCRDTKLISGLVTAIDLMENSVQIAKKRVQSLFIQSGFDEMSAKQIANSWFFVGDFLLMDLDETYTHVIGNPPYVRIENIPKGLLGKYRCNYETMTNRADLYVAFFERSLKLLQKEGSLSFICADRWTKNTYGKELRNMISQSFALDYYIDCYQSDAFESNVMTYPAITQIRRGKYRGTKVLHSPDFSSDFGIKLRNNSREKAVSHIKDVQSNGSPWILKRDTSYEVMKKLESTCPLIEDAACKVFIGTATGANKIYIVDENSKIESERLIPTITAKEIRSGEIRWNHKYIINTYDDSGVIDLKRYPNLCSYLSKHKDLLKSRHVGMSDPINWFRTIDRIFLSRAHSEKLMISDIGNEPTAVIDCGTYQPNNSIYYICSSEWDLNALKCVILSQTTRDFIASYSTKIANGYLRFQAQHLRKLRLPKWDSIPDELKSDLLSAGLNNSIEQFDEITKKIYKL